MTGKPKKELHPKMRENAEKLKRGEPLKGQLNKRKRPTTKNKGR